MITLQSLTSPNFSFLRSQISQIDLRASAPIIQNEMYRGYYLGEPGGEHYKLLAQISLMFNGAVLFDIGTHIGGSSLAMGYNPNNTVISYDIVDCKELLNPPSNVTYKIGDFRTDSNILRSPYIFIDAHHNGTDEKAFHEFFLKNNYKGIVLWDDIHLNPEMTDFWKSVNTEKYDLTGIGHATGTGLIIY